MSGLFLTSRALSDFIREMRRDSCKVVVAEDGRGKYAAERDKEEEK